MLPGVAVIRLSFSISGLLLSTCTMWTIVGAYNVSSGFIRFRFKWAPVGNRLAITYDGLVQILDTNAADVASISTRHPQNEYPGVFWWRDGKQILVVGRESQSSRSRLSVFDATSGQLLGIADFDPLDLLPYEQAEYTRLSRDGYSLRTGWGVRSAGHLLDTWSQLEFDPDQCLMRGTVYRPEGPCELEGDTFRCLASERCIEVSVCI